MDVNRLCPDKEWHSGYTWIPRQPLTKTLCQTYLVVWHILGEPTRFCREQLLINRNIFSRFVTTDAVVYKPISNI